MKQIRTVLQRIEHSAAFDEAVNRLLADGWTLKKRETLKTLGELSEAFNARHVSVLYAELEKEVPPWPEEITQ